MPITQEQIELFTSELIKVTDQSEESILATARLGPEIALKLGIVEFKLRHGTFDTDTLTSLIEIFPAHTFLAALTLQDLPVLAEALQKTHKQNAEAYRVKVS